jgi:predicted transcriptional regulator
MAILVAAREKANEGKVSLKAGDVMVREVITIDENMSVKEAADIMNQFEIGSIIATRKGKAVGIITERDLLKRIVAEGKKDKSQRHHVKSLGRHYAQHGFGRSGTFDV